MRRRSWSSWSSDRPPDDARAESVDDGCEGIAPGQLFATRGKVPEHRAAQLGVRQAFEHCVELHSRLEDRFRTEEARVVHPLHLRLELLPRSLPGGGELGAGAKAGDDPLECDAVPGRMFEDQPPEHGNADGDQIGHRIVTLDQPVDFLEQELERSLGERVDEETLLRTEQAVHRPGGRAGRVGYSSNRKCSRPALGDKAFRHRPERGPGLVVVLSGSSHS